ncbi:MAG: glucokinase [Alsobacter sp.]
MIRHPVLLADIGATLTRLAVVEEPGAAPFPLARLQTTAWPGFVAAALPALAGTSLRPRSAILAAAGRLSAGCIRLTNAPWRLDPQEIGPALGLQCVVLVNDYVPVAALLGSDIAAGPDGLHAIGPVPAGEADGARVVIGAGTGLGVATAVPFGRRTAILTTEAGHVSFGACESEETALWALLERAHGRITAESVLSAPGLLRLHRALAAAGGLACHAVTPADVTAAASRGDAGAMAALRLHARLLGRFSGDMALSFGATGGVFLGGGLPPRLLGTLQEGGFTAAFAAKAPFADLMKTIPAFVLGASDPALDGLAAIARNPSAYVFPAGRFDA